MSSPRNDAGVVVWLKARGSGVQDEPGLPDTD